MATTRRDASLSANDRKTIIIRLLGRPQRRKVGCSRLLFSRLLCPPQPSCPPWSPARPAHAHSSRWQTPGTSPLAAAPHADSLFATRLSPSVHRHQPWMKPSQLVRVANRAVGDDDRPLCASPHRRRRRRSAHTHTPLNTAHRLAKKGGERVCTSVRYAGSVHARHVRAGRRPSLCSSPFPSCCAPKGLTALPQPLKHSQSL